MSIIKKILVALLISLPIFAAHSSVLAQTPAALSLSPSANTINSTGSYTLSVQISSVTNLGSYGFDLVYNPAVVTISNYINSSFLASSGRSVSTLPATSSSGKISVGAYSLGASPAGPSAATPTTLATFTVTAVGSGTSTIAIQNILLNQADINATVITGSAQNGSVTVSGPTSPPLPTATRTPTPMPGVPSPTRTPTPRPTTVGPSPTGGACTPLPAAAPSNLSPTGSITAGTRLVTWTGVSGASFYALRINDLANPWVGSCALTQNAGDVCIDTLTSTSYSYTFVSGHKYTMWVHALNSCSAFGPSSGTVSVTASGTAPTSPPGTTSTPVPGCPRKGQGDADCNGVVDGIDYSKWLNSQCVPGAGQTCASYAADFNGDRRVDDGDYSIWFNNRQ